MCSVHTALRIDISFIVHNSMLGNLITWWSGVGAELGEGRMKVFPSYRSSYLLLTKISMASCNVPADLVGAMILFMQESCTTQGTQML